MKIGTKSLLFGYHQFIIHPILVAISWKRIFGNFPRDVRIWIAFFIHDIGYLGINEIDGAQGDGHPELGGKIMDFLFGKKWGDFCRCHSFSYAKNHNMQPSKLYVADKLACTILPIDLHVFFIKLSGEIKEYMEKINIFCPKKQAIQYRKIALKKVALYLKKYN